LLHFEILVLFLLTENIPDKLPKHVKISMFWFAHLKRIVVVLEREGAEKHREQNKIFYLPYFLLLLQCCGSSSR